MQRNRKYRYPNKVDRNSLQDIDVLQKEIRNLKAKLSSNDKVLRDVVISTIPCINNRTVDVIISVPQHITLRNPVIVNNGHSLRVNSKIERSF